MLKDLEQYSFFYNKKLEAEMLRASLLIYLDTLVLFLIVLGSSVLDRQGVRREMCWFGILCSSVTVTD